MWGGSWVGGVVCCHDNARRTALLTHWSWNNEQCPQPSTDKPKPLYTAAPFLNPPSPYVYLTASQLVSTLCGQSLLLAVFYSGLWPISTYYTAIIYILTYKEEKSNFGDPVSIKAQQWQITTAVIVCVQCIPLCSNNE